tara:strand:+ start:3752 stop:4066 length:315 start_codon:yes stop_codon:yes gene_type:complete
VPTGIAAQVNGTGRVPCRSRSFPGKEGSRMLILTRRVGETLNIGNEIQVTVLGIRGNQVRIGVNAPKDVPVHREEIFERIQQGYDPDQEVLEEPGENSADSDRE